GAGDETTRRSASHGLAYRRADARHLLHHGSADAGADSIRRQRDVVVATMNRLAWAAAALGATAFLVTLAFTGGRGGPGLEPFVPKGLMTIPIEDVREIDVAAPRGHWHFVRTRDGWRATQGIATAGFEVRLDSALKLLRNSGPDRVLTEAEVARAGAAQFGLAPP